MNKESNQYIDQHIENMTKHSRRIKDSCDNNKLRYFDTSNNFHAAIIEATEYVLDGPGQHSESGHVMPPG